MLLTYFGWVSYKFLLWPLIMSLIWAPAYRPWLQAPDFKGNNKGSQCNEGVQIWEHYYDIGIPNCNLSYLFLSSNFSPCCLNFSMINLFSILSSPLLNFSICPFTLRKRMDFKSTLGIWVRRIFEYFGVIFYRFIHK